MTETVTPEELDLSRHIRRGDALIWGHAAGEPTTLLEALTSQRADIGPISAFAGSSFSDTLQPEQADFIRFKSMGAIGTLSRLSRAGVLDIAPIQISQIAGLIMDRRIPCDAALVQVSPRGPCGRHSYGLINDYIQAAIDKARVVIAEINERVPYTRCDAMLDPARIDVAVNVSRSPVSISASEPIEIDRAIASHAVQFIEDGSVLQMGVGSAPDAITRLLVDRRRLGCHSGMIGDGIWKLTQSGALTNETKPSHAGVTIAGALLGSPGLYAFADRNPLLKLCSATTTHAAPILASIPRFVSINTATEVDLTGQVNAEQAGDAFVGAVGGMLDFVRGAALSPRGRSIIALPATAKNKAVSRIVAKLSAPATIPRADVDVIVTEFGAAELRGRTLKERARSMIEIAHPDCRAPLERAAFDIFGRGY